MSSAKGLLLRLAGGLVLTEARVRAVDDVAPGFRAVRLDAPGLRAAAGDKLQVLLPGDDVRTYTPIPEDGGALLLGWLHADTPGPRWLRGLRAGDAARFLGPQRSLSLADGPTVIIGDETSIAVAAAYARARPGETLAVIEAADPAAAARAAHAVGAGEVRVVARADGLPALIAAARDAVLSSHPGQGAERGATVGITGGAALIQAARAALRDDLGACPVRVKAYWAPGKVGLD